MQGLLVGTVLQCLQLVMILHTLQIMLVILLTMVSYEVVVGLTLDSGGAGVYDSPLATDQLGGRSGVKGLEALQVSNIELSILFGFEHVIDRSKH